MIHMGYDYCRIWIEVVHLPSYPLQKLFHRKWVKIHIVLQELAPMN